MPTTLKLKNSVTAAAAPSTLVQGEAAVNVTDKKVWVGNAASSPVQILGAGATIDGMAIGATTATTGKFTTLEATGVATFSAGTVSAPAITTTGDTNTGIFFPTADTIAFTEGGVESMRIDSSGNLLVGTTTNLGKVSVQGTIAAKASADESILSISHNGSEAVISASYGNTGSYDPMVFKTSDTERMRITSTGNVGIGTSSPATKLHVKGAWVAGEGQFQIDADSGQQYSGLTIQNNGTVKSYLFHDNTSSFVELQSSDELRLNVNTANALKLLTNDTERMRIDSSGNVIVSGTSTSSDDATYQGGGVFVSRRASSAGTTHASFLNGGSSVGSITSNTVNTFYNNTSDYRLKENVAPMTGALAKVQQLKPCTYTWKLNGSAGQGFIAHELQAVVPDCVTGEKDAVDKDGKPKYQGVDTSFLVATLTKAIQEQQALIENLTTRLNALEGN